MSLVVFLTCKERKKERVRESCGCSTKNRSTLNETQVEGKRKVHGDVINNLTSEDECLK